MASRIFTIGIGQNRPMQSIFAWILATLACLNPYSHYSTAVKSVKEPPREIPP